jgi:hypothetical protein
MDPHHFGNLDPHLPQIKIRIRISIRLISWIGIRTNWQMTSQKKMYGYEPILALFQGFEPLLESLDLDPDPNPHQGKKSLIRIHIRIPIK